MLLFLVTRTQENCFSIFPYSYILSACIFREVMYSILYIVYCILYIVYFTLYIVHCILYIVHCTLYIVHGTKYKVQKYKVHCT